MSKHYHIVMQSQQYSPVCAIASATMIIQFKHRVTPSWAMLGVPGDDYRLPNYTVDNPFPTETAQENWLRSVGFTLARTGIKISTPLSECATIIEKLLIHHGPFIFLHYYRSIPYGPNYQVQKQNSAHAVVINGIAGHTIYFCNPWGNLNVPVSLRTFVGAIARWEKFGWMSVAYLP